jgi:hypothetical protein
MHTRNAHLTEDGQLLLGSREITSTDEARNPYGRFGLGYEINFQSVTWRIEATHVSSLATSKDRGVNSISINARWFPFR